MSKDGYYGDFDSFSDEQQAYEEHQRQQYESECGSCPTCNATIHQSELVSNDKCVYCDKLINLKEINELSKK